jgi:flagellar biosynthesis/type III secretory pathway M-ring protein FliF/YscJ
MKHFVEILKQFTREQRLLVLTMLLFFTSGSFLLFNYMKVDDCRPLIEENLRMHQDFAKISAILRGNIIESALDKRQIVSEIMTDSTIYVTEVSTSTELVLSIADSYKK